MHLPTNSNECGELATLVIDWLCQIAHGSLKPGVLGLGWAAPACSYRGAEGGVDRPGVVETRYLARTKPGEVKFVISTIERAWGVGLMIVWRSHWDKWKEKEYNDFLGVLIVSSKSQAHNDDS